MATAIFALVLSVTGIQIAYARVNNNDPVQAPAQLQDNISARFTMPALTTSTSTVGVDLSNTTNFKHFNSSGAIEVSQIRFEWSTLVPATTTIKVGVIASSSANGAVVDVYYFDEISFVHHTGNLNPRQSKTLNYQPGAMKLGLSSGAPISFITNEFSTSTTEFATTTYLTSPLGKSMTRPNVGDLIYRFYEQAGTATTSITTDYRVK